VDILSIPYIAIPERYEKLILSLKTNTINEYTLDKEALSYDDLFDAMRLSLRDFKVN
jgi:hypothetical protein